MLKRLPWRLRVEEFLYQRSAASAVEFAILAPLFVFFLMAMIAYGIYFGAAHSIQQIAADAARTAVAGLDEDERQSLATSFIEANAGSYPFIDGDKLTVEVNDSTADANQFFVSIRYDARELPIWRLLADLPLPGQTITKSSTIRIGGI